MCRTCSIQNYYYPGTVRNQHYTSDQLQQNLHKIHTAVDYLHIINRKWFKLNLVTNYVPYGGNGEFFTDNGVILAHYQSKKHLPPHKTYYGCITLNIHELIRYKQEEINETMRHEYAHAVVSLKYGLHNHNHGAFWIRIAKLMRVDTKRYEKELKIKT